MKVCLIPFLWNLHQKYQSKDYSFRIKHVHIMGIVVKLIYKQTCKQTSIFLSLSLQPYTDDNHNCNALCLANLFN